MADRWKIQPGKYEYTRSDGTRGATTVSADGTYLHEPLGGEAESGTWRDEGEWSCITPHQGAERRYSFSEPDASGWFNGVMDNGVTARLHKIG